MLVVQNTMFLTTVHLQSYQGSWATGQRVSLAGVRWGKAKSCQLLRLCKELSQALDAVVAIIKCVG